jgi:dTDP-4-dehydrorhamnose 3,5-epimerase-like enzyme
MLESIIMVAVSSTFAAWQGRAPAGFARGFYVISDYVEVQYKCTGVYNNKCESGMLWNDHRIGSEWPVDNMAEIGHFRQRQKRPYARPVARFAVQGVP